MSFGIYTIQFYVQSSLPLLRRFLLVSLCYITITERMNLQINNLLTDENLDKVEKLEKIAEELGTDMSVLALSWILRKDIISSVITGASKSSQLDNNLAASGFVIPQNALLEIDKILDFHKFTRHVG